MCRHAHIVKNSALSHQIDYLTFLFIDYKSQSASQLHYSFKSLVWLMKPFGGVASGRVLCLQSVQQVCF